MAETRTEDLEKHLRTLGLPMGASLEEIKKRYRFMASVMHEDVVADHQKEEAKRTMVDVNEAWSAIESWFKANPGVKTTPLGASAQAAGKANTGGRRGSSDDVEDFESFEKRTAERFGQQGVSLEELDKQRRKSIAVKMRRDFVFKARVAIGIVSALYFLSCAVFDPSPAALHWMHQQGGLYEDKANQVEGNRLFALLLLGGYLFWCFAPAAKTKTEEWIDKAGNEGE